MCFPIKHVENILIENGVSCGLKIHAWDLTFDTMLNHRLFQNHKFII